MKSRQKALLKAATIPGYGFSKTGRAERKELESEAAAKQVAKRLGVTWPPANGWHTFKTPTTGRLKRSVLLITDDEIVYGNKRVPLAGVHADVNGDVLTIEGIDDDLVITVEPTAEPAAIAAQINALSGVGPMDPQVEADRAARREARKKAAAARAAATGVRSRVVQGDPIRRVMLFHKRKEAKLRAEHHQHDLAELGQKLAQVTDADGVISPEGFRKFVESAQDIDIDTGSEIWKDLLIGLAQGGTFLPSETSLILKKGERSLLDSPVSLLKEVADREFRGGSRGFSVPIGGGVRFRAGAVRGHMVTIGSHWTVADAGTLTVTDQRVVYHGGRKTLEFPYAKLATLNVYSDAIDLGVTTRQNTSSFGTDDADLIAGIIHGAINHQDNIKVLDIQFQN